MKPDRPETPAPGGFDLDDVVGLDCKRKTARQFLYRAVGADQTLGAGQGGPAAADPLRRMGAAGGEQGGLHGGQEADATARAVARLP